MNNPNYPVITCIRTVTGYLKHSGEHVEVSETDRYGNTNFFHESDPEPYFQFDMKCNRRMRKWRRRQFRHLCGRILAIGILCIVLLLLSLFFYP